MNAPIAELACDARMLTAEIKWMCASMEHLLVTCAHAEMNRHRVRMVRHIMKAWARPGTVGETHAIRAEWAAVKMAHEARIILNLIGQLDE